MPICAVCSAPIRPSARFCTQCGTAVPVAAVEVPEVATAPERTIDAEIPARIPSHGRMTPPPQRSTAATWAFITGVAPLLVSIVGNVVSAQLSAAALQQVAQGDVQGAWAPVFVSLAIVFVANAALLTVCIIAGGRGLRETANGITLGRGLAVAGLAAGGVNLVLWVVGLIVSVNGVGAVLS